MFRDLGVLRAAGIPLMYDEERRHYRIGAAHFLRPTSFTPEEALALMVLCHELGNQEGVPFYGAARAAAAKIEGSLPERLRDYLRDMSGAIKINLQPTNRLVQSDDVYHQLLEAVRKRTCVRIRYDSFTPREILRTKLHPYQLLFSRRSWYVIGRSSWHRAVRTFNVGRILELEMLSDRYRVPRGFKLGRYLRNAWHLIPEPGPDYDVVVRFLPLVARNVAEVSWHKTQQVEFLDDGSLDFRVTVSGLSEISWWILGYGDQAIVREPEALRQLIVERTTQLLARYGANGPPHSPAGT